MSGIIVKAAPDQPYYLTWVSQTDAPGWVFSNRQEVWDHLTEEVRFAHPYRDNEGHLQIPTEVPDAFLYEATQRLDRADAYGSSSMIGSCRWNVAEFQYRGSETPPAPPNHYWVLPRKNLVRYCELVLAERSDEVAALFETRVWED